MVNKLILTFSCLLLTAETSMQGSRFATVNFATMTIQNDGSAILNRNSYLGFDELGYFAKRLYVNNTPTVATLSNTECAVFGIGAIIVAALVGCGLYCLSKPSNQKDKE